MWKFARVYGPLNPEPPTALLSQFLQDILDTLFVILDDNTEKYGLLVFQSLVSLAPPDFASLLIIPVTYF